MRELREEFREIEGFERYQIGDRGSVFSTIRATRFLKWVCDPDHYPYVQLMSTGASTSTRFYIHFLVARAFIPNPSNLRTVNHINGIKHDNDVSNLEWASYTDQQEHALSNGLNKAFGETHYAARLTWNDVDEMRMLVAQGMYHKDVAARFGCDRRHVTSIVNGRGWARRP